MPPTKKYIDFSIPKKNGGERLISAPCPQLNDLQRRLANILYACQEEISKKSPRKSLSHGFKKEHSIITNAKPHKRRRYVLNLDIENFFPSFNFGRVRGFFISNNDYKLNENVATILAQIACHNNALPQGSPCSPIISDIIAHILDVRLSNLAKDYKLTYSRYADDLTFSTSAKEFPKGVSLPSKKFPTRWVIGSELKEIITRSGFSVNKKKTRMQFRGSRQLVTGLTVNTKVNIRPEYYRAARAMCANLFKIGTYHLPQKDDAQESKDKTQKPPSLQQLEGILSHIYHVKNTVDPREWKDKQKHPSAFHRLYRRFLVYRYFVAIEKPLIICEGKTDNTHLKIAIQKLSSTYPLLGSWKKDGGKDIFYRHVSFFSYERQEHRKSPARSVLGIYGGEGNIKNFFFIKGKEDSFKSIVDSFKHKPQKHPVIVLVDNDTGGESIFTAIKKHYDIDINLLTTSDFYHITENLYLIKTPEIGAKGTSCIEDLYTQETLKETLSGKKFNPSIKEHAKDGEYGKELFAKYVIVPKLKEIDFSGFKPLLSRIEAVIKHHAKA